MQCSKCRREAIVFQPYSGQHLCPDHFIIDFETKAKREVRKNKGMLSGDHIAVALTGTAADDALLFFFQKLAGKRKDIRVSGVPTAPGAGFADYLREQRVTKLARATSLEAAAVSILSGILRGDVELCFAGATLASGGIPVIAPFCHIPAGEIATYARIHGIEGSGGSPRQEKDLLYADVQILLADYTSRHPAAPHAVLNLCEAARAGGDPVDRTKRHE